MEPREHHTVHQVPGRRRRSDDVVGDVVDESISSKSEEDLTLPTRVVGGCWVLHDGHKGLDVVKSGCLGVEGGDVVGVETGGEGGLDGGASWTTGAGLRMRRCAVDIWAVRVALMARSCSRARDTTRSCSCEAT